MSILAVAGASGVGKSTFMRTFLSTVPGSTLLTSTTTRAPRDSDIHIGTAHEYEYVTHPEFDLLERYGSFPEVFKQYDTFYAHRLTLIKEALESPDVYLGALLVPGVEMLCDLAREKFFKVQSMRAIYLTLSDEERRRRLTKRGETSAKRFEENLDQWETWVRQSDAPFITIDASGSPEAIVQQVIERFGFAMNA